MTTARQDARDVHSEDLEGAIASTVTHEFPELREEVLRLATNLKRAANVLIQREEAGLLHITRRSTALVRTLTMIWLFEPIEARDIVRLTGFSRQSVSGVLTTLERDGYIDRERGTSHDRRLAPVSISSKGRTMIELVIPKQNAIEADFFDSLTTEEQATLTELLAKVIVGSTKKHAEELDDR
jgi:DNA-binding MarR family transcriptional regulator